MANACRIVRRQVNRLPMYVPWDVLQRLSFLNGNYSLILKVPENNHTCGIPWKSCPSLQVSLQMCRCGLKGHFSAKGHVIEIMSFYSTKESHLHIKVVHVPEHLVPHSCAAFCRDTGEKLGGNILNVIFARIRIRFEQKLKLRIFTQVPADFLQVVYPILNLFFRLMLISFTKCKKC